MSVSPDPSFWKDKRVFVTGHTGFKGSWLCLWLQHMGAELAGFALDPPTTPSMFEEAKVAQNMMSTIGDIRDREHIAEAMAAFDPQIVLHMAAQPLVRLSYKEPIETFATNVMGTAHVIEAARAAGGVKAIVSVTTDKCYENKEWVWGYREDEPMGGRDPYSASKGCAELVTAAYRQSFCSEEGIALASARAGNVIGGGDWADDRLIPDILRALEKGEAVSIRNPLATRPWQHVLESLCGYLVLAERLYADGDDFAEGWNFGPTDTDARPVQWIVEAMIPLWRQAAKWEKDEGWQPHEARFLKLDISKANARLDWSPRWQLSTALDHIVTWHKAWLAGDNMRMTTLAQIEAYQNHT